MKDAAVVPGAWVNRVHVHAPNDEAPPHSTAVLTTGKQVVKRNSRNNASRKPTASTACSLSPHLAATHLF